MIGLIKSLLQGGAQDNSAGHFERLQVATCALLLEVAHGDGHYQAVEARVVHNLLADRFGLSPAAIAELVDYAHSERRKSADLFQFTREINAHFTPDEKLDIMEGVWRVIYADGELDQVEDALARQLAQLLRLSHKDVIDRKLKVMNES